MRSRAVLLGPATPARSCDRHLLNPSVVLQTAVEIIAQIGNVFSRPGVDLKLRLSPNLGALVAQQSPQLKARKPCPP